MIVLRESVECLCVECIVTFFYSVKLEMSDVLHTESLAWMEGSPHKHFDSVLFHIRLGSLDEGFQPASRTQSEPS